MLNAPTVTPVTIPSVTVAFELLLLHVPPPEVVLNVVEEFTHTADAPLIAAGNGLTVTNAVTEMPETV